GEYLPRIAGGANLSDIAFNLIEWAEAQGRLDGPDGLRAVAASGPAAFLEGPFRVPHLRNPLFVGRAQPLDALSTGLRDAGGCMAVSGVGGLGKTQLAVEYA